MENPKDNIKDIVIGKNNIGKCLIDYTYTKDFKVSKNQGAKDNKDGETATVRITFKGALEGIMQRLGSGKPVIDLQNKIRADWKKGIVPSKEYTITYGAQALRGEIISEHDKEIMGPMSDAERYEYLAKKLGLDAAMKDYDEAT